MLASVRGILAIDLGDSVPELQTRAQDRYPNACLPRSGDPASWWERLQSHVEDPMKPLDVPLDLQGTQFQLDVYAALQSVAPGHTVTYADLAAVLMKADGARAVAGACARNRLALVVPCHRVVGQNRALTGYRWGLSRKAAILQYEAALTGLLLPTLFDE